MIEEETKELLGCLLCGLPFAPANNQQRYCSKECRSLAQKKRNEEKEDSEEEVEELIPLYPDWVCQYCGDRHRLNFDPRECFSRFEEVECPNCGRHNACRDDLN